MGQTIHVHGQTLAQSDQSHTGPHQGRSTQAGKTRAQGHSGVGNTCTWPGHDIQSDQRHIQVHSQSRYTHRVMVRQATHICGWATGKYTRKYGVRSEIKVHIVRLQRQATQSANDTCTLPDNTSRHAKPDHPQHTHTHVQAGMHTHYRYALRHNQLETGTSSTTPHPVTLL